MSPIKSIFAKFSKRERAMFGLVAGFVLSVALYIFIVEPLYKAWNDSMLDFKSARLKLFKNLRLLSGQEVLEREYDKYKEYIQEGQEAGQGAPFILNEIEAIALESGVKITSIKPKATKKLKGNKGFKVEVVSEAKISQFLKFMYNLESSKMFLKIERLVLSLKSARSDVLKGTLLIKKVSFL